MFFQAKMHLKRLGDVVHLSGPLGLLWNRISFSRLTLLYFSFSVVHFVIQLSFQIKAFTINANASSFLSRIVNVAQTTNNSLPFLDGDILRMCSWVPANLDLDVVSCPVVWNGTVASNQGTLVSNAVGSEIPDSVSSLFATSSSASVSSSTFGISFSYGIPYAVPTATSIASSYPTSSSFSSSVDISTSSTASTSSTSALSSSTVLSSISTSQLSSSPQLSSSAKPKTTTSVTTTVTVVPTSSAAQNLSAVPTTNTQPTTVTIFVPQPTKLSDNGNGGTVGGGERIDNDGDGDHEGNGDFDGISFQNFRRDVSISASTNANSVSVTLIGLNGSTPDILNNSCLWALNWPVSVLGNTKREDMVFIGFQIWVLGMSIVALLNESIPHIIASLATHMIATAWAGFQIAHTAQFRRDFNRVITNGACHVSLLPDYWNARAKAEIPSLALNVLSLAISSFLTWKLIKLFGWQTFKRVGASLTINRIYKFVLILSITIQLSLFFMIVTVSLWIDQLMNNTIGDFATLQKLYKVTSMITLALLIPWLMTGWFAVRRELKVPTIVFLALSILYLGGWGVMFISTTFRWTFVTWTFFSIMATTSVILTVLSVVLVIICSLNFGKGLARYLNSQQPLDEEDNASLYSYDEKVSFPSSERPLPTYYSPDVKPTFPGSVLGPRFSNKDAEPFETHNITYPAPIISRNLTDLQLQRTNSYGSTHSSGSSNSDHSKAGQRRWVIE
ncbi:hypothetical protein BDN70DRAFT_933716 [Pholiota conissans]|uniref:Uncharacterized protein n=1 Tax=Pholiota conissans TaxID=109636 RepID=A0A9P6CZT8_9AGAR|nr:hypothetical protein BDN70DRAFT_933716 [Pholiota conissans]